jgi:hypothetical protein
MRKRNDDDTDENDRPNVTLFFIVVIVNMLASPFLVYFSTHLDIAGGAARPSFLSMFVPRPRCCENETHRQSEIGTCSISIMKTACNDSLDSRQVVNHKQGRTSKTW